MHYVHESSKTPKASRRLAPLLAVLLVLLPVLLLALSAAVGYPLAFGAPVHALQGSLEINDTHRPRVLQ